MATSRPLATSESLAVLTDTVNQTLIDTGRFFKNPGSLQARTQLKASIPASYQRFQAALDALSEQIFVAKAYLEKDYENAVAKRTAPKVELEPAPVSAPAPVPASIPEPDFPPVLPAEDVPMLEAPAEQVKEPMEMPELPQKPIKTEPIAGPETIKLEGQIEPGAEKVAVTEPVDALKIEETAAKGDQGLPLTTGDDINFDSMLATAGEVSNDFDLNFNFTNDEIGDQNFLAGTDFGNTNTNMVGEATNDNGMDSISSLLPGLESYATDNNAGDNFNFDLPRMDDQSLDTGNVGQDDLMAPGESSFDDLFMEKDNLEGENNLLGGDLMELGDLDDSWLT